MSEAICAVATCDRNVRSNGYCNPHLHRLRRYGHPEGKPARMTEAERFWSKVNKTGRCWVWSAGIMSTGYGTFTAADQSKWLAHRYSYTTTVGPIPDGLVLDHLCRNRQCVNPAHLEVVESAENMRRGTGWDVSQGRRSACLKGHEYTPDNIYRNPSRPHIKICRECTRERDRQPHRRTANRRRNSTQQKETTS